MSGDGHSLFERLLLLTGKMNYMWTNTESLLIHMIAGLAGTDKETAVIIFLTLNTTRARIDLVERLAKAGRCPDDERDAILDATRQLARLGGVRNHFNHCIYSFDADSGHAQTILMRISDRKQHIKMGRVDPVDELELDRVQEALDSMVSLNRAMWQLIVKKQYPA